MHYLDEKFMKYLLQHEQAEELISEKVSPVIEALEPRVMLAADLAALNELAHTAYLEGLDKYLEENVFPQELLLINDNLQYEQEVTDFVSNIDETLANFKLDGNELSISGFRDEIDALFGVGADNYNYSVAVSGNEYSNDILFQLNFSFSYTAYFDAKFDLSTDDFKLVTMISNLEDGSSVKDMVAVDITLGLSYSFSIGEDVPEDNPDKFYVDRTDAGGVDGQQTINNKNDEVLLCQKIDDEGNLVFDSDGNAVFCDTDGNGTYKLKQDIIGTTVIKDCDTDKYLSIDADGTLGDETLLAINATALTDFDTIFSVTSKTADSQGLGSAFSLQYKAVLSDDFSAIGMVGGMTALIYEKDNPLYNSDLEVISDEDLLSWVRDFQATATDNTFADAYEYLNNHNPESISSTDMLRAYYNSRLLKTESYASGDIVTSINTNSKYTVTYNSADNSFTTEDGMTATAFAASADTKLLNEDVNLNLYAKMSLVPDMEAWTDMDIDSNWWDNLIAAQPELNIETPIIIHAGQTTQHICTISAETYEPAATTFGGNYFQGFEVVYAPTIRDFGMFWGTMIETALAGIRSILDPAMPGVEALLMEVPGLSDFTDALGLGDTTVIGLVHTLALLLTPVDGGKTAATVDIFENVLEFITLVDKGALPEDSQPDAALGDLSLGVYRAKHKFYEHEQQLPSAEDNAKAAEKYMRETANAGKTPDADKVKAMAKQAKQKPNKREATANLVWDFGFDTPLFTSPGDFIYQLMSGTSSGTLFNFDISLDAFIEFKATFPFASVGFLDMSMALWIDLHTKFDISAGFDLKGMDQFLASLDWDADEGADLESMLASVDANANSILKNGFYIEDKYDTEKNKEKSEFEVALNIKVGVMVNTPKWLGKTFTIEAGARGGITMSFNVDINDLPNKLPYDEWRDNPVTEEGELYKYNADESLWVYDHHTHLDELADMHTDANRFTLSFSFKLKLEIFADLKLETWFGTFYPIRWKLKICEIPIWSPTARRPDSAHNIIAALNYNPPVLAGWQNQSDGVLELYVGDKADQRHYVTRGDNSDASPDGNTAETYVINVLGYTGVDEDGKAILSDQDTGMGETVEINYNGFTQQITGVKQIVGDAGSGEDKIYIRGKNSHEVVMGVTLSGGSGDDLLSYTGIGAARMFGNDGNDELTGGSGNDYLDGGSGNDVLYARAGVDTLLGGAGLDELSGGKGDDTLDGGSGGYAIIENTDDDGNVTYAQGAYSGDLYYWDFGDGNDVIDDTGVDQSLTRRDIDSLITTGMTQRVGRNSLQQADNITLTSNAAGEVLLSFEQDLTADCAAATLLRIDGVEDITLGGNGGGDVVDIYDYSDTDLESLALNLDYDNYSPGGSELNIHGTAADDTLQAYTERNSADGVALDSLAISRQVNGREQYILGITQSDMDTDYLNMYGYEGDDTIKVVSDENTKVSDYLKVGVIDGGAGDDYIEVDRIDGRNETRIIGNSGNDHIIVRNSTEFAIVGDDSELVSAQSSGNDIIEVYNSEIFTIDAGNGDNRFMLEETAGLTLLAGTGKDILSTNNISDFDIDLGDGDAEITVSEAAIDGKIISGSGFTSFTSTVEHPLTDTGLLRTTIELGGGGRIDEISIQAADALILRTSDDADRIIVSGSDDVKITAGDGDNYIESVGNTNLQVALGSGADEVKLDQTADAEVKAGAGDDIITASNTNRISIYGEDGADTIISGYAQAVISGGDGLDTVSFTDTDSGDSLADTVRLLLLSTVLRIQGTAWGTEVTTDFSGIESMALNLGSANNGGGDKNRLDIEGLSMDLAVTGSSGNDRIVVDTQINHKLTLDGMGGEDRLEVTYQDGYTSGMISTVDREAVAYTLLSNAGSEELLFRNIDITKLNLTDASDTFTVTAINNSTSIYAGTGDDRVIVDSAAYTLNVYGGADTDADPSGVNDSDTLILRLSGSVPLTADTFKDIGVTTEVLNIQNNTGADHDFMISNEAIYSGVTDRIMLADLAGALGAGMLDKIVLSGGTGSDTLTIDDTAATEAMKITINEDVINYGSGNSLVLQGSSMLNNLNNNLYNGISVEVEGKTYFYYQDNTDHSSLWSYSAAPDADLSDTSRQELVNYVEFRYRDTNYSEATMRLLDRDFDGYYEINSAEELLALMRTTTPGALSADYELMNDLDLSGLTLQTAIGSLAGSGVFTGTFNGQGCRISGLNLNETHDTGLFYRLGSGATIENLEIYQASVVCNTGNAGAGMLAGAVITSGAAGSEPNIIIKNVKINGGTVKHTATGTVAGYAGGLIGRSELSSTGGAKMLLVLDSYVCDANVSGVHSGGILGAVSLMDDTRAVIKNCMVEGLGSSGMLVKGGIIGQISVISHESSLDIQNSIVRHVVGDIYVENGIFESAAITDGEFHVTNCWIDGRGANVMINGIGASVVITKGTFVIESCTVHANNASAGLVDTITAGADAQVIFTKLEVNISNGRFGLVRSSVLNSYATLRVNQISITGSYSNVTSSDNCGSGLMGYLEVNTNAEARIEDICIDATVHRGLISELLTSGEVKIDGVYVGGQITDNGLVNKLTAQNGAVVDITNIEINSNAQMNHGFAYTYTIAAGASVELTKINIHGAGGSSEGGFIDHITCSGTLTIDGVTIALNSSKGFGTEIDANDSATVRINNFTVTGTAADCGLFNAIRLNSAGSHMIICNAQVSGKGCNRGLGNTVDVSGTLQLSEVSSYYVTGNIGGFETVRIENSGVFYFKNSEVLGDMKHRFIKELIIQNGGEFQLNKCCGLGNTDTTGTSYVEAGGMISYVNIYDQGRLEIVNCYYNGYVAGDQDAGGLIGRIYAHNYSGPITISNSAVVSTSIIASYRAGGMLGAILVQDGTSSQYLVTFRDAYVSVTSTIHATFTAHPRAYDNDTWSDKEWARNMTTPRGLAGGLFGYIQSTRSGGVNVQSYDIICSNIDGYDHTSNESGKAKGNMGNSRGFTTQQTASFDGCTYHYYTCDSNIVSGTENIAPSLAAGFDSSIWNVTAIAGLIAVVTGFKVDCFNEGNTFAPASADVPSGGFTNIGIGLDEAVTGVYSSYTVEDKFNAELNMDSGIKFMAYGYNGAEGYLYAADAGKTGIVWYEIAGDGSLKTGVNSAPKGMQNLEGVNNMLSADGGRILIVFSDNNVSSYEVNQVTGKLQLKTVLLNSALNYNSSIAVEGVTCFAGTDGGIYLLNAGCDRLEQIAAPSGQFGAVKSVKLSADGKYMYAVHGDTDSIAVYSIDAGTNMLTLVSVIREGENGVRGIAGVTDVIESDGYLVAVGAVNNTVAVFSVESGHRNFEQVQYLRNGAGISNLVNPQSVHINAAGEVSVICINSSTASVVNFSLDASPEAPKNLWTLEYNDIDALKMEMGVFDDVIELTDALFADITINTADGLDNITVFSTLAGSDITIDSGAGNDRITLKNSDSATDFDIKTGAGDDVVTIDKIGGNSTISTGDGADTVTLGTLLSACTLALSTGAGDDSISVHEIAAGSGTAALTSLTVDSGSGADSVKIELVGLNSKVTLSGGTGDDSITLYAAGIANIAGKSGDITNPDIRIYGNAGTDKLIYYGTPTNTLQPDHDVIEDDNNNHVAEYWSIENFLFPQASLLADLKVVDPDNVIEGGAVTLSAAASYIPVDLGLKYEWDLNNDGVYDKTTSEATLEITLAMLTTYGLLDDGVYNVAVKVSANGQSSTATAGLKVKNKKRQIKILGSSSVQEDNLYTLTLDPNNSSEPSTADIITSWKINWGDGMEETYTGNPSAVTHIYKNPGAFTIAAVAFDNDGATESTSKSLAVTVDSRAHINILNGSGEHVAEGATYRLSLKSDRPQSGEGTWKISWGDGNSNLVSCADTTVIADIDHVYADGSAAGTEFNITIELVCEEGTYTEAHAVTVDNIAPVSALEGAATAVEGTPYQLTIKAPQDPGTDSVSKYLVDWGDGKGVEEVEVDFSSQDCTITHTYPDASAAGDSYRIKVVLVDEDGTYDQEGQLLIKDILLENAAPNVTFDQAGESKVINQGGAVTLSGFSYSDIGQDAVQGWIINWGDGITEVYSPEEIAAADSGIAHSYAEVGEYTVSVSAWDDDSAQDIPAAAGSCGVKVNPVNSGGENEEPAVWVKPVVTLSDNVASVGEGEGYVLTLSGYIYASQDSVSIDELIIDWGDGTTETLSAEDFSKLRSGEDVQVAHVFADDKAVTDDIAVTFRDNQFKIGGILSESTITEGDTATADTVVLGADGKPYWNGRCMVLANGMICSPGLVTADIGGVSVEKYYEIVSDKGVYKLRERAVSETQTDYLNDLRLSVAVTDIAPEFDLSGALAVTQGQEYKLDISSAIDVAGDGVTSYRIDWGDGSSTVIDSDAIENGENVADGRSVSHIYETEGEQMITISQVSSEGTEYDSTVVTLSNTLTVTVLDAAMDIDISGNTTVGELHEYTLNLGEITDPANVGATVTPLSWIIDWGDGGTPQRIANNGSLPVNTAEHVYYGSPDFVYNISVSFEVVEAGVTKTYSSSVKQSVKVVNNTPEVSLVTATTEIVEGNKFSGIYKLTDPTGKKEWHITVDYGDGSAVKTLDITSETFALEHIYADNGDYNITINVVDTYKAAASSFTTAVAVSNYVPVAHLTGSDTVDEGVEYSLDVSNVFDTGTDTVTAYIIDWGDGKSISLTQQELTDLGNVVTHKYADDCAPEIKLSVTDEDGTHSDIAVKSITVSDVAPVFTLSGSGTVTQGMEYTLNISAPSDVEADTVSSYVIDWGDGSTSTVDSSTIAATATVGDSRSLKHAYATEGEKQIRIYAVASDGRSYNAESVTLSNTLKTEVIDALMDMSISGAATVNELGVYTLNLGAVSDPANPASAVIPSKWIVTWGDGEVEKILNTGNVLSREVTHNYQGAPEAEYTISVSFEEIEGDVTKSYTATATQRLKVVNNTPEVALVTATTEIVEGNKFSGAYKLSDNTSNHNWLVKVNYGDNTGDQVISITEKEFTLEHIYADDGEYQVTVSVVDDYNAESNELITRVKVKNFVPVASITGVAAVTEGVAYSLQLDGIYDSGADTISSFNISWGDGEESTLTLAQLQSQGYVVTHTFADNCNPQIKLSVTDEDGTYTDIAVKNIEVANAAPSLVIGNTVYNVSADIPFTQLLKLIDSSAADYLEVTVNYGDGRAPLVLNPGQARTQLISNSYGAPGQYKIQLQVKDDDGGVSAVYSITVNVASTSSSNTGTGSNSNDDTPETAAGNTGSSGNTVEDEYSYDDGEDAGNEIDTIRQVMTSVGGSKQNTGGVVYNTNLESTLGGDNVLLRMSLAGIEKSEGYNSGVAAEDLDRIRFFDMGKAEERKNEYVSDSVYSKVALLNEDVLLEKIGGGLNSLITKEGLLSKITEISAAREKFIEDHQKEYLAQGGELLIALDELVAQLS